MSGENGLAASLILRTVNDWIKVRINYKHILSFNNYLFIIFRKNI
jgi:hypothetical protein